MIVPIRGSEATQMHAIFSAAGKRKGRMKYKFILSSFSRIHAAACIWRKTDNCEIDNWNDVKICKNVHAEANMNILLLQWYVNGTCNNWMTDTIEDSIN